MDERKKTYYRLLAEVITTVVAAVLLLTLGGKVLRILICAKSIIGEFVMQLHPKAILGIRVSGQIVASNHVRRALAYVVLFVVLTALFLAAGALLGL